MTQYCSTGDTPKVYFKFDGTSEQIYQSNVSPIDVSMEDITTTTPNYNASGFGFSFFSTNNGRSFDLVLRDYEIRDNGANFPFQYRYELRVVDCSDSPMYLFANIDPSSIVINTAVTCGNSVISKKKSRLHIKIPGNSTDIFTVSGDYPGSFKVACGDCPEGTCRCDSDNYPGYCCLDCASIAAELHECTDAVRRINR